MAEPGFGAVLRLLVDWTSGFDSVTSSLNSSCPIVAESKLSYEFPRAATVLRPGRASSGLWRSLFDPDAALLRELSGRGTPGGSFAALCDEPSASFLAEACARSTCMTGPLFLAPGSFDSNAGRCGLRDADGDRPEGGPSFSMFTESGLKDLLTPTFDARSLDLPCAFEFSVAPSLALTPLCYF